MSLASEYQDRGVGKLPGHLGIEVLDVEQGHTVMRLPIRAELLAPNGYLHAASVVGLADTAAGYGCAASLPTGAVGFTTIELKSNFLGTLSDGALRTEATLVHGGRSTQIWDAPVIDEATGKALALFRCTQMVLWPR
ncbi:MAG: PaaI family thioesterase [Acidimicrobiia bacterium]